MNQNTILFDLDGTLTDSGEGIIHCAQIVLEELNLPVLPKEDLRFIVGPPLSDSFIKLGVAPNETDNAIAIYRKYYLDFGIFENTPYPGIAELLRKLKQDGHTLYVATSKPEFMAQEILARFGMAQYFDCICGALEDKTRNAKSEVISHLLSVNPIRGKLLMVGDTNFDVLGAKKLGIPTIGVSWGYGIEEDLVQAGAIAIAHTTDELYSEICKY